MTMDDDVTSKSSLVLFSPRSLKPPSVAETAYPPLSETLAPFYTKKFSIQRSDDPVGSNIQP